MSAGSSRNRVVMPTKRRYSAAITPIVTLAHCCRPICRHSRMHASALRRAFGIEQPMQMNDEIAHLGVVDGTLSLCFPRRISGGVIRVDADEVDFIDILELGLRHALEF